MEDSTHPQTLPRTDIPALPQSVPVHSAYYVTLQGCGVHAAVGFLDVHLGAACTTLARSRIRGGGSLVSYAAL